MLRVGGGGGGSLSIDSTHIFANNTARDNYFTAHAGEKVTGVFISVGAGFQQWDGSSWVDKTAVVQGPQGIQGPVGSSTYAGLTDKVSVDLPSINTALSTALGTKVATSVTVNGHALTSNVTVSKSDVGLGSVDNSSLVTHAATGTGAHPAAISGGSSGLMTGTDKAKLDAITGTNTGDQTISDATITFSNITTGNVSTSQHGFAPRAPNDATKYLDGTGAYTVPAGTGGGSTATLIDGGNATSTYTGVSAIDGGNASSTY